MVAVTGYTAAWLRGWPPVRVYRAAAWSLVGAVAWLAALEVAQPGFMAAREPGRNWGAGWDLPPGDLAVQLYQMIESGTGAAYYADMLYACVVLAVTAPGGPPVNTAAFLDRLDAKWLQSAGGRPPSPPGGAGPGGGPAPA